MFRSRRLPRTAKTAVAGAIALLLLAVAACSGSEPAGGIGAPAQGAPAAGGTATVALPAGVTPNYIFPFLPNADANAYNQQGFEELLFRPLYYVGGNDDSVAINYPLSTADAPVYAGGGKTVTITMKGWKWSDGETVDAADLIFWLNMMKAERANFYGYLPGLIPDNLASYGATGPETVVLHLKSAVSSLWFTDNQLAELTPMPLAWDITKAGGAPGSGGCSTDSATDQWAKCIAVYDYLSGLAKDENAYATSPTWAVVDGPWKLSEFSAGGDVKFVPNPHYSGAPRPQLDAVELVPFADDATEFAGLKTRSIDVGYIPPADLAHVSGSEVLPATDPLGTAYTLAPDYEYGIDYYLMNFHNPTYGPVFSQLYVRQALQEVMDQEGMIKAVDNGYGYPTSGAVPQEPESEWIPAVQSENGGQGPYPYSIAAATALLTTHGWAKVGGVMTCESPAKCGSGITKGTRLSFTIDYPTGITAFQGEVADYQTDADQAGIRISLVPRAFDTIVDESAPCAAGPTCSWDMLYLGGWSFDGPGYEPTGQSLFATGAETNSGSYSNPTEDGLIADTRSSGSLAVFKQYATYTDEQLPVIWMPEAYAVQAVTSKLANVAFNALGDFTPEYWHFTR